MATVTAADIKKLREATGAGMTDCKTALVENEGDYDKALEFLRIKGLKGVAKREGRAASNGLIAAKLEGTSKGVLLELNCETDFVAKSANFISLADWKTMSFKRRTIGSKTRSHDWSTGKSPTTMQISTVS